jgi:hypothetical protein
MSEWWFRAGGAAEVECPECHKMSVWLGATNVPYGARDERPADAEELLAKDIEVLKPRAELTCRACYHSWRAGQEMVTLMNGETDPVPPFLIDSIGVEVRESESALKEIEAVRASMAQATRRQRKLLLQYDRERLAPIEARRVVEGRLWEAAVYHGQWSAPTWVITDDYSGMVWRRPWRVASKHAMRQLGKSLRHLRESGVVVRRVPRRKLGLFAQSDEYEQQHDYDTGETYQVTTRRRQGMPSRYKIEKPIWQHQLFSSWPVRGVEAVGYGLAGVYMGWMAFAVTMMVAGLVIGGGYLAYLLVAELVNAL